jgi:putative ABC transport system substrate-binding protein
MHALAARAQQAAKLPTIGYLGTAAASASAPWTAAFVQRLHELGWIDGRTVAIQYRWAEGRAERSTQMAAELARLKVDVIVTGGNAALATKQASSKARPYLPGRGRSHCASSATLSQALP